MFVAERISHNNGDKTFLYNGKELVTFHEYSWGYCESPDKRHSPCKARFLVSKNEVSTSQHNNMNMNPMQKSACKLFSCIGAKEHLESVNDENIGWGNCASPLFGGPDPTYQPRSSRGGDLCPSGPRNVPNMMQLQFSAKMPEMCVGSKQWSLGRGFWFPIFRSLSKILDQWWQAVNKLTCNNANQTWA